MDTIPVEERILQVLHHLGIEKAHFGARLSPDWSGLATNHPNVIASLTLACPTFFKGQDCQTISARLLIYSGDQPIDGERALKIKQQLSHSQHVVVPAYETLLWTDIVRDRAHELGPCMIDFMRHLPTDQRPPTISPSQRQGEVAGITYQISGAGEPLVLLPLGLAASGWDPLLEPLSQRFCTIVLGGPELGILPVLEERGRSSGYLRMLRELMNAIDLKAGESVLDVGCGTGVVDRWLAHTTRGLNRICAVDVSPYLLREAAALAGKEKLDAILEFRHGNAEALPFPDGSFDVTFSTTVMEEVDADRMLAELIRVTKPGGRVGIIVRAMDMPRMVNIPLRTELRAKYEVPQWLGEGDGCASVTLYARFHGSELVNIEMWPHLAVFDNPYGKVELFLQSGPLSELDAEEAAEWRSAVKTAADDSTFFMTWPHHCAVGSKP